MAKMGESKREILIRKLSITEMKKIYEMQMKQDFPENELKPFSSIQRMWEKGVYQGYGLQEEGEWKAYWFLLHMGEERLYLLDYLAVIRGNRGKSYGSKVLEAMRETICQDGNIIFIEVEDPDRVEKPEQIAIRNRRLSFYQRNHCRLTAIRTEVYQAPYLLLLLGETAGERRTDVWIRKQYERFYMDYILPENGHTVEGAGLRIES